LRLFSSPEKQKARERMTFCGGAGTETPELRVPLEARSTAVGWLACTPFRHLGGTKNFNVRQMQIYPARRAMRQVDVGIVG
jgi:hypothetical protein